MIFFTKKHYLGGKKSVRFLPQRRRGRETLGASGQTKNVIYGKK